MSFWLLYLVTRSFSDRIGQTKSTGSLIVTFSDIIDPVSGLTLHCDINYNGFDITAVQQMSDCSIMW